MCTFKEVKVQRVYRRAVQKGQVIPQGNTHIVIDYGRLPTSFGIPMSSQSALKARGTGRSRAKKRSRSHSSQISPLSHFQKADTDVQVKTLTLEM